MNMANHARLTASVLRYHLRVLRSEQLVLPAALWALFALMLLLFKGDGGKQANIVVPYLGMIVPLAAGILAAAMIVDDPAIELQFAAPRRAWYLLLERTCLVLAIAALFAVAFQLLCLVAGVPLASLGGVARRQLAWLVPTVALCALSAVSALAMRQSTGGALLVGLVWLVQVLMRESLSATKWGRYVYLFMTARQPAHPDLVANQASLLILSAALTVAGALLLVREERYL